MKFVTWYMLNEHDGTIAPALRMRRMYVAPLVIIEEISTGEVNCMSMYGSRSLLSVHHVALELMLYMLVASAPMLSKLFEASTNSGGAKVRLSVRSTSPFSQPIHASIMYVIMTKEHRYIAV